MGAVVSLNKTRSLRTHGLLSAASSTSMLTSYLSRYPVDADHCLLINSLSGAADLVATWVETSLAAPEHLPQNVSERLRSRGYYFESPSQEQAVAHAVHDKLRYHKEERPLMLAVCPTYQCNFHCTYCYEGKLTSTVQTMTVDDLNAFFKSVEAISAMHPNNDVELQLFGGEPLLAETKGIVEAVLAYAQRHDYPVSIVSNGSNVDLYLPTFLANKDIISQVAVTLDGPPYIHNRRRIGRKERDTFTTIVNGVDTLLGIGVPVSVGMNLDAQNVDAVPELIKFFIEKGWTEHDSFYIELQAVDDRSLKGNAPHQMLEHDLVRKLQEHWPQISGLADRIDLGAVLMVLPYLASVFGFLDMDKLVIERPVRRFGHYCWVTTDQLTYYFGPDGRIYLCPVALGNPALSVGRFAPQLDLPADVLSRWKDRNMFTMAECTKCRIGPLCGGGCAVTSLLRNPKEMCADCGSSLQVVDGFVSELIVPKLRDQCRQGVR